jgi:hypothetical protein
MKSYYMKIDVTQLRSMIRSGFTAAYCADHPGGGENAFNAWLFKLRYKDRPTDDPPIEPLFSLCQRVRDGSAHTPFESLGRDDQRCISVAYEALAAIQELDLWRNIASDEGDPFIGIVKSVFSQLEELQAFGRGASGKPITSGEWLESLPAHDDAVAALRELNSRVSENQVLWFGRSIEERSMFEVAKLQLDMIFETLAGDRNMRAFVSNGPHAIRPAPSALEKMVGSDRDQRRDEDR